MNTFEIFTFIGILLSTLLGGFNLAINITNQRKTHRELIYQKQIEFFIRIQSLIIELDNLLTELSFKESITKDELDDFYNISVKIDNEIDKNALIIPKNIYIKLCKFSCYCYNIRKNLNNSSKSEVKTLINNFTDKHIDLNDDIRDFIGFDKLSNENKRIIRRGFS
jgi:hypothetical protein